MSRRGLPLPDTVAYYQPRAAFNQDSDSYGARSNGGITTVNIASLPACGADAPKCKRRLPRLVIQHQLNPRRWRHGLYEWTAFVVGRHKGCVPNAVAAFIIRTQTAIAGKNAPSTHDMPVSITVMQPTTRPPEQHRFFRDVAMRSVPSGWNGVSLRNFRAGQYDYRWQSTSTRGRPRKPNHRLIGVSDRTVRRRFDAATTIAARVTKNLTSGNECSCVFLVSASRTTRARDSSQRQSSAGRCG